MQTESSKNTGPTLSDGETCGRSHQSQPTNGKSMSSAAGSRAKMSASPSTMETGSTEIGADCGLSLNESLAFFDRASCAWKTRQGCLFGGLMPFSADWPRSGLMLSGALFRRVPLVQHTCENGCSFWATPRKSRRGVTKDKGRPGGGCRCLETDLANRGHIGPPNPAWQEWLMGFPVGWTDVEQLETQCHQSSRNESATESSVPCP